jgi:hypothetical protein
MHVAVALAVVVLALAAVLLLAGLTPFIGIPLAILIALVPVAFFAAGGRLAVGRRTVEKSGVPSSGEASYDPTVDPGERGP